MRLYTAHPSPFARKILVAIQELGLQSRVEHVHAEPPQYGAFPASRDAQLARANPLGKVPVLVTDEGETLYDSVVIADYLDALDPARALCPAKGSARWRALREQAMGDGMLDAGVAIRLERLRPQNLQWDLVVSAQLQKLERALDRLNSDDLPDALGFTVGTITLVCALEWLQFRQVLAGWQDRAPQLAAWYGAVSDRPSFASTRPELGSAS